jgi:hypothetical protein
VINAHPELRERELLKREGLLTALADALSARGFDGTTARLAATVGLLAFEAACTRWVADDDDRVLGDRVAEALGDLAARAAGLAQARPAAASPGGEPTSGAVDPTPGRIRLPAPGAERIGPRAG